MAVAVHLGIGVAMGMMEFGLAMITANLAFVSAPVLEAFLVTVTGRAFESSIVPDRRSGRPPAR
jgi:hypothetical protein